MGINVSFNGATIYRPGAYSKLNIDLGGAFPLGPTGLIGIIGESEKGTPGDGEVDIARNVFSAQQIPEIIAKYGSGPIVDACNFLFAPASDGAIPSGAQAVYIYKTNSSVQASLALANTYGTVNAIEYGVGGNRITYKNILTAATAASSAAFDPDATVGLRLSIYVQGAAINTFTVPARAVALVPKDMTELAGDLLNALNWSAGIPAGVSLILSGAAAACILTIALTGTNSHRLGNSRTFELAGTALVIMNLTAGLKTAAVKAAATITLNQKRDLIVESETLGGNIVLKAVCANAVASATITIDEDKIELREAAVVIATFQKNAYSTVKVLAEDMSLVPGWTVTVATALYNQLSVDVLDHVTAVGCLSSGALVLPALIMKDAFEVREFFGESQICELTAGVNQVAGLPDARVEANLVNGAKGATLGSDIVDALTAFTGIRLNAVIPLMSRDATDDIADGLTDDNSTYTIDAVHQAVKTHLSLMATTQKKSERQGYLSFKAAYDDCLIKSNDLADARVQLAIQDTKNIDAQGNIKWFQPYALSCMMAGARAGAPVGTPLTFKYFNCSGIRQTAQAMSTPEIDIIPGFNPGTQYDEAIQNGISFLEAPQSGGFRMVVDNTTYGKDGNWVYNRGNVLYTADVLLFDFRTQVENLYVGVKNTVRANEIKSTCESILTGYLAQGMTVSTEDAPNGYKALTVRLEGNTIFINVTVKLVEGIDFVLLDVTVQRASNAA
jgi:hypothetical protein